MKLSLNNNELDFHRRMKANDATYPSLPRSIKNLNEKQISELSDIAISHANATLVGFKSRVHNWTNDKKKALNIIGEIKDETKEIIESIWD